MAPHLFHRRINLIASRALFFSTFKPFTDTLYTINVEPRRTIITIEPRRYYYLQFSAALPYQPIIILPYQPIIITYVYDVLLCICNVYILRYFCY